MSTLMEELTAIKAVEDKLTANKVANFAYTNHAYENPLTEADGVASYDPDAEQNIPNANPSTLLVNSTILTKGWRAQASSITRMLMNHFLGRCSYNLNKVNDLFSLFLTKLMLFLGKANGIATLDANTRLLNSQLPTIVSLADTNITNLTINTGDTLKVTFDSNVEGEDTSTPFTLSYENTDYPVKAYKEGQLVSIYAKELTTGNYMYIHKGVFLDLWFDGEQFIVIGNPVVLSGVDYKVYANGKVGDECVGTVKALTTVKVPYGWKKGEGQAISRVEYKDLFEAYRDQTYDSDPTHTLLSRYGEGDGSTTFNLPDYSEVSLVGVGSNTVDSVATPATFTHDTFTQGEYKNDQFQDHRHWGGSARSLVYDPNGTATGTGRYMNTTGDSTTSTRYSAFDQPVDSISVENINSGRHGDVTRGKSKGVTYIVKVYA